MKVEIKEIKKRASNLEPQKLIYEIIFIEPILLKEKKVFVNSSYIQNLKKPLKIGTEIEVIVNNKGYYEIKYIY